MGRIRAITINVKINTDSAQYRGIPSSLNAREAHSDNVIARLCCKIGKTIIGNAPTQTMINMTNQLQRILLINPIQVTTSPTKMFARQVNPTVRAIMSSPVRDDLQHAGIRQANAMVNSTLETKTASQRILKGTSLLVVS